MLRDNGVANGMATVRITGILLDNEPLLQSVMNDVTDT